MTNAHLAGLAVPCSDCGAEAGHRCSHWGAIAAVPHRARLEALGDPRPVLVTNWLLELEEAVR